MKNIENVKKKYAWICELGESVWHLVHVDDDGFPKFPSAETLCNEHVRGEWIQANGKLKNRYPAYGSVCVYCLEKSIDFDDNQFSKANEVVFTVDE